MHNTVTIDGRGYAEPRGPFHWARTADARLVTARVSDEGDFAVGVHTGYGFPLARAVLTLPGSGWLIVDALSPRSPATVEWWWHLHPAWVATRASGGFSLAHASGSALALATTVADGSVDADAAHSPEYGRLERACTIRTSLVASGPTVAAAFVPLRVAAGRCPLLSLVDQDSAPGDWRRFTFAYATADGETHVTVAFPRDLETHPRSADWPQPCIQEFRASCVE
jgi:hypothetical protein